MIKFIKILLTGLVSTLASVALVLVIFEPDLNMNSLSIILMGVYWLMLPAIILNTILLFISKGE